jgi:hypothetical protein
MHLRIPPHARMEKRKNFFFEKKKQKTFVCRNTDLASQAA